MSLVEPTGLDGVFLVTPKRIDDARGSFSECWNQAALQAEGIGTGFVQDNMSRSHAAGTVRGLHYQAPPFAQAKLVRCGKGALFDVAVDIRQGSATYGQWVGFELSAANGRQLFIPQGFAHGFMTLEADTEALYKCSAAYAPAAEAGIHWDSCGITWPQAGRAPILSPKDAAAPDFREISSPFQQRTAA